MIEAEKIKVQIETFESAKRIVEQQHAELVADAWEAQNFAKDIETLISTEVSKLRFALKQLSRQAIAANLSVEMAK